MEDDTARDYEGIDVSEQDVSESDSNMTNYLLNKVKELEREVIQLTNENNRVKNGYNQRVKWLEEKKRNLESEKLQLDREVRKLRAELERIKSMPLVIGTVTDVLDNGKLVVRSTTGPSFLVSASQFISRDELFSGARIAMNQQSLAVVDVLPTEKDPNVLAMEVEERPRESYDEIGGLSQQLVEIKETVELPLIKPEAFEKVGVEPPKGVLLYSPPGTGKTLLAKAVARETNSVFIKLIGSELVRKYIGEGARLVRELFKLASDKSPSIVFIDEIDAIGAKRTNSTTSGDREVQRTLMQLLAEMDGFDPRGDVKLIGATNRPDILDPAMLRPGRFDRLIQIELPNLRGREEIFKIHTRRMTLDEDVEPNYLARLTEGTSGADIKAICTEAGMYTIRNGKESISISDFEQAIEKVKGSDKKEGEEGVMFS